MPLELDQIYSSLDDLTVALGPTGANKNGALSDLLETTAENFGGQGAQFHQTIEDFSKLSATLDNNKEELFGSAARAGGLHQHARQNDQTVRSFNQSLADVSTMLAGERSELAAALQQPRRGAGRGVDVRAGEPRDPRPATSQGLNRVSKVLVKQRGALDEILTNAPVALNNLYLTYNPQAGTLDTRANQGQLGQQIGADPAAFLCCDRRARPTGAGGACNEIEQALRDEAGRPASCRAPARSARPAQAARGRTASTRRSADSWRCRDEAAPGTAPAPRRLAAADRLRVRRLQAAAARAAPTPATTR